MTGAGHHSASAVSIIWQTSRLVVRTGSSVRVLYPLRDWMGGEDRLDRAPVEEGLEVTEANAIRSESLDRFLSPAGLGAIAGAVVVAAPADLVQAAPAPSGSS